MLNGSFRQSRRGKQSLLFQVLPGKEAASSHSIQGRDCKHAFLPYALIMELDKAARSTSCGFSNNQPSGRSIHSHAQDHQAQIRKCSGAAGHICQNQPDEMD